MIIIIHRKFNGIFTHASSMITKHNYQTVRPDWKYNAVSLIRGQFSHRYSQKTPKSSPVRARYGLSYVDPASDWYSASVSVIISVISYNIGRVITVLDCTNTGCKMADHGTTWSSGTDRNQMLAYDQKEYHSLVVKYRGTCIKQILYM